MNDFINKIYEINEDLLIFSIISIAIELKRSYRFHSEIVSCIYWHPL